MKLLRKRGRCIPMLPVMQVGRVRPGAPPEHDVLHPVGGGLEQARPTNNIGIHGDADERIRTECRCESAWAVAGHRGGTDTNEVTIGTPSFLTAPPSSRCAAVRPGIVALYSPPKICRRPAGSSPVRSGSAPRSEDFSWPWRPQFGSLISCLKSGAERSRPRRDSPCKELLRSRPIHSVLSRIFEGTWHGQ